jgi:hypothetical protein
MAPSVLEGAILSGFSWSEKRRQVAGANPGAHASTKRLDSPLDKPILVSMTVPEKSFLAACMVLVFLAAYWTGEFTGNDLREGLLSTATFAFAFWMGRFTYARELKRAKQ